jgi:Cytidylate kinase-like family
VKYTVVCMSSQDGTQAGTAARLVAHALDYRLIDEDIVARAAVEAGVDKEIVADVERRKSLVSRLLEGFAAGAAATAPVPPEIAGYSQPPSDSLRELIRSVIMETADAGNVVIASHAASFALADRDNVFRVLVTASKPTRVGRIAGNLGVDQKQADRLVKQSDAGRADYIKRFYGISSEQPTHYDLVVNTDKLAPEEAARLMVDAVNGPS